MSIKLIYILFIFTTFFSNILVAQKKISEHTFKNKKEYQQKKKRLKANNPYPFQSIFLKSKYIELGIHPSGSFGSDIYTPIPPEYHKSWTFWDFQDEIVGFNCDIQKDGYENGTPPYIGDYFVPGAPLEGWGVKWNSGATENVMINFGAIADYAPEFYNIPVETFFENSTGSVKSVTWTGTASVTEQKLWIQQTVKLGENDMFFTIEVMMKNVGTETLENVKYFRSVDPDNEVAQVGYSMYTTRNYVLKQPGVDNNPDVAVVVAEGLTYGEPLILGTIDSRAKVAAWGVVNDQELIWDPDIVFAHSADYPTKDAPRIADIQIALAYSFGNLEPNQCVKFVYYYNMEDMKPENIIIPVTPDFSYENQICSNNTNFIDQTTGSGSSYIMMKQWDFNNDGIYDATGNNVSYTFPSDGNYPVKLRIEFCDGSEKVIEKIIQVFNKPVLNHSVSVVDITCHDANNGQLIVSTSSGNNLLYKLNDGEFGTENTFNNLAEGQYSIIIKDQYNCEHTFSQTFTIKNPEPVAITIDAIHATCPSNKDGKITFQVTGGIKPYEVKWTNSRTELITDLLNLYPDQYSVNVSDKNNCILNSDVLISANCISNIIVPNIFSPNYDGMNDLFVIKGNGIISYSLKIMNRWGWVLFESSDIHDSWDGKYKGNDVAPGVYFFILNALGEDNKAYHISSFLHLVR